MDEVLLVKKMEAYKAAGSSEYKRAADYEAARILDRVRIREFRDFVKKHAPDLVDYIYQMPIGEHDGRVHNPTKTKLRTLAKAFREGKKPAKD